MSICVRHELFVEKDRCPECRAEVRPKHETLWACAVVSGMACELVKIDDGEPCYVIRCFGVEKGRARWPVSYSAPYITRLWEELTDDPYPSYAWHRGRLS